MTDELTPVRCGCGGEATVDCYLGDLDKNDLYYVYCPECNIQTANYLIEAEAITAWNRAMSGARRDKIAITKGYWRVTYDGLYCSVCNYKCETTALPDVCPHCGTSMKCGLRLEWDE